MANTFRRGHSPAGDDRGVTLLLVELKRQANGLYCVAKGERFFELQKGNVVLDLSHYLVVCARELVLADFELRVKVHLLHFEFVAAGAFDVLRTNEYGER